MAHDFTTPEGRLKAIEELGAAGYNEAFLKELEEATIETVAGHPLRRMQTIRFGEIICVGFTGKGFKTLDEARDYAERNPAGSAS